MRRPASLVRGRLRNGIQNWTREPVQFRRIRTRHQIKYNHFVSTLRQPRPRQIKRLLRTDIPKPSERVTVHPHRALSEKAHVEKCISDILYVKRSVIKNGAIT